MEPFRNDSIDIAQLPKMEDIQFTKLPGEYLSVKLIIVAIQAVILIGGLIGFFFTVGDSFVYKIEAFVAVGLFIAYLVWYSWLSFHRIGYHLRERDMLYHRGVLSIRTTVVPYNRIQHVTIDEGVLMRVFSLASLNIYTAGGTSSDLHIPGLHKNTATRIKEFLTEEVTAGVATLDDEPNEPIEPVNELDSPVETANKNPEKTTEHPGPETEDNFVSSFVPHPPSKPISRIRSVDDVRSGNIRKAGSAPKFDVTRHLDDSENPSDSQK
ncbi:MAG: PH domain-containing protein [Balneolales bacterium]|nr:PH domain-containing protein [Balneolales bacterium]